MSEYLDALTNRQGEKTDTRTVRITIDLDPMDYEDELEGADEVFPDGEPYWDGFIIKVPLVLRFVAEEDV